MNVRNKVHLELVTSLLLPAIALGCANVRLEASNAGQALHQVDYVSAADLQVCESPVDGLGSRS